MEFPEILVVATTRPVASVARTVLGSVVIARFVVVAFVDVEFTVMKFVEVKFVIVATAAVKESAIAVVNRASVEKKDVEVAFVIVAFVPLKFATVDEPNAMRPLVKVSIVVVAPFTNGSCTVVPVASEPHTSTPAAVAFTSHDAAFRFETTSCEVEAVPETARFVVVALVVVVFRNVLPEVKTFSVYVFAIVVEESAKLVADVVDHVRPTEARYVADDVEKKSRVFFHASADVVDHASPASAKYAAEVVEKKFCVLFQKFADELENEFAIRWFPS